MVHNTAGKISVSTPSSKVVTGGLKRKGGAGLDRATFHAKFDQAAAAQVYDDRPNKYVRLMQLVSLWAAITNILQITLQKILVTPKKNFRQILWETGRDPYHYSSFFIDRLSPLNHQIKIDAASSMALDTMYDWDEKIRPALGNTWANRVEKFWFDNSENRRALVNRKKMVHSILLCAINDFLDEPEVRIISVACGSARAVIDAILACDHPNVQVVLIDRSKKALRNAQKNMEAHGIRNVTYIEGKMGKITEVAKKNRPHIVEMVGLTDYLKVKRAADYSQTVSEVLEPGGYYLTGNIHPNPEKIFLDWGLLWPMNYKTPENLMEIGKGGGTKKDGNVAFRDGFIKIFCEPLGIHGLLLARKESITPLS